MTVEKINKWCDNCPHVACETCQITWTDIEELKKDIKDNYISKDKIRDKLDEIMKLTEEEKKAMEYAKYQLEELHKEVIKRQKDKVKGYGTLEDIAKLKYCNLKILLNLIEKLQKENEELREITNAYNSLKKDSETFGGIPLIIADEKYFNEGIFTTNFIPKDKIREKIKDLQKDYNNDVFIGYEKITGEAIKKLKELLEESE